MGIVSSCRNKVSLLESRYHSCEYDTYILFFNLCNDLNLMDLCYSAYKKANDCSASTLVDSREIELSIIRMASAEQQQIISCIMDALDCGILNKSHRCPSPIYNCQWRVLSLQSKQYI